MSRLRKELLHLLWTVKAPTVPLCGWRGPEEVLQLQVLREDLRLTWCIENAYSHPYVTLQVHDLW
nr:unnamed protein product [Callosobruchus chinensis]